MHTVYTCYNRYADALFCNSDFYAIVYGKNAIDVHPTDCSVPSVVYLNTFFLGTQLDNFHPPRWAAPSIVHRIVLVVQLCGQKIFTSTCELSVCQFLRVSIDSLELPWHQRFRRYVSAQPAKLAFIDVCKLSSLFWRERRQASGCTMIAWHFAKCPGFDVGLLHNVRSCTRDEQHYPTQISILSIP